MNESYRFERFELDPRRRTLARADSPVVLTPKAFDVLLFLVKNANRLVTKEELLQAVWGDTFVEEGNLKQYISHLRKALGDNSEDSRLIVTIARKGYQFTANVRTADAADTAGEPTVKVTDAGASRLDSQPILTLPASPAVPKPSWQWWKPALALSSAVIVLGGGYLSWRHVQAPGLARPQKVMLAVLPFENLTGDSGKEYLADGLTEEMISQLSRLTEGQVGVIARTSVMGYKGKDERLDQIGRDLSVQYILENSLRESGNHLRLTAQLIQVKDQTHLWSKDYDYPVEDILAIEDDVAKAVALEIGPRLTPQLEGPAQSNSTNPEAFDAYLRGFYFFQKNPADSEIAKKYYERAIQLDASYALAWVGLSRLDNWQVNRGLLPAEEGHRLARQAVERALTLNPNLAVAHAQMGRIEQQVDFDWASANASFMRATALEPGNPEIVATAAFSAAVLGRFDEALRLARRAVDLDPLNADSWELLGQTKLLMGQLNEAAADSKRALELNADVWPGPILSSQISILRGRAQDAWSEIKLVRHDPVRALLYSIAYSAVGREKDSDRALSELITKYHASAAYQIAEAYAFRNNADEAFEWLERAYAQRDGGLIGTKVDPLLNNLRHDSRYAALLKKLNFPN